MRNQVQAAAKQDRIEEIRLLLCKSDLTTSQIEYITQIKPGTLRHYLDEMKLKNYVATMKLAVKGCATVNMYRITCDGRSLKPKVKSPVVDLSSGAPDIVQWWQINLGANIGILEEK